MNKDHKKVQDLNESLYYKSTDYDSKKRRKIHDVEYELDEDFDSEDFNKIIEQKEKYKLPNSFFKKIFFFVFFVFLGALVFTGISLFGGKKKVSSDLISLDVIAQPFVDGGEELDIEVRIQNFNEKKIQLPDLVISYKKDSAEGAKSVIQRRSLTEILPNERISEDYSIVLFGQEGDIRDVKVELEYRIEGSTAIFVKEKTHEVVIRSTPTQFTIEAPDSIVKNQEFDVNIKMSSYSGDRVRNLLLRVDFPQDFVLLSSDKEASFGDNIWEFKEIHDDVVELNLRGRIDAFEGQSQSLRFTLGKQDAQNKQNIETVFNQYIHTVEVEKSFIDTRVFVNNSSDEIFALNGGEEISASIDFESTALDDLYDVEVHARFEGALFDPGSVRAFNGFYDSNESRIVWSKDDLQALALLNPGATGQLNFNLKALELSGPQGSLSNPELSIFIDVFAYLESGDKLSAKSVSQLRGQAHSDIRLVAATLHENGPFKNSGPTPPEVARTTSYTLSLQATNSSNDLKNAFVSFELPGYVNFLDKISPTREFNNVSFDEQTRLLTWQIGNLPAGTGFGTLSPRSVSLNIEITPSQSQRGTIVNLTRDIYLKGFDDFTQTQLSYKNSPLTTILKTEGSQDGRVK